MLMKEMTMSLSWERDRMRKLLALQQGKTKSTKSILQSHRTLDNQITIKWEQNNNLEWIGVDQSGTALIVAQGRSVGSRIKLLIQMWLIGDLILPIEQKGSNSMELVNQDSLMELEELIKSVVRT